MAIVVLQETVGTAAAALYTVPPGECELAISVGGTSDTVYIGTTANVTAANGFPMLSGSVIRMPSYLTSSSTTLYAIGSTTGIPVGIFISNTK